MRRHLVVAALIVASAATAALAEQDPRRAALASFFALPGYLAPEAVPDSLLLNPPPPAPGSLAEQRDQEAAQAALTLQGTPRWALARRDADFTPAIFSCAAGLKIDQAATPNLYRLMNRTARDFAGSTSPTKRKYMRARPFAVNGKPMCTPNIESVLRADGSYPSGHSAIGYGWGLVLAQAIPDRAAQLVARGRAFGDSRRVCNVHWLSDVEEGRIVGAAVVARLNAESAFQADVAAARAEVAALKERNPGADCAAEAAALAQ